MAELKAVEAKARLDLEVHLKAEIEQLEQAKKTELAELEDKHGREIEELTAQEKRMMHDFAVMKDEIERSINERIDYIKQIETYVLSLSFLP
jgi:ACT domain-containing protein